MANLSNRLSNLILNTDSYKTSHWVQYPEKTQYISSYIEARGGTIEQVLFFGLQAFIKQYLLTPITQQDIDEAEILLSAHGVPFHKAGWQYILEKYQGLLPVEIEAIPEGTVIGTQHVVCQLMNTDPQCYWLVSYLETALLRAIWYPSTVASISYACKQVIQQGLVQSADNLSGLPFKLHDFGARGVSSLESAALGGLAHLVNFQGTDTVSALIAASRWYQASRPETIAAYSIPAAEHSTITAWGKESEVDAYRNMLRQFGGQGKVVAVVSDSYDLFNAIDQLWGEQLKAEIIQQGATLVIRPDSGNPVEIVCAVLQHLADKFGYALNTKGFKVLPDYIRVIQGDGLDLGVLAEVVEAVIAQGFSIDNVSFGMGGGLLQAVNRDTLQWAMKTSAAYVDGQWRDVFKDPVTSSAKRSKKGRLALICEDGQYQTLREEHLNGRDNLLQLVYRNGQLLVDQSLAEIRNRTDMH